MKSKAKRLINDRYEIERSLGEGGAGEVFLVRDRFSRTQELIALKLLRLQTEKGVDLIDWFKREFHTLSTLRHPGLARVFDFGRDRDSGQPFYTTEFVTGADLFVLTRDLDLTQKLEILTRLTQAVDYIHTKGVLHNDLKPSNVLVEEKTLLPKLLDFGLSNLFKARTDGAAGKTKKEERLFGTPNYMAPELIQGGAPTFQSDLYALGMILYKVLAGQFPHAEKNTTQIFRAHLAGKFPPPSKFAPEVPESLDRLILSLLAKSEKDRPRNAQEILAHLTLFSDGGRKVADPSADSLTYVESAQLIGREREMRLLTNYVQSKIPKLFQQERTIHQKDLYTQEFSLDDFSGAEGNGVAIIHGASGLGKSFLLETLKHHYQLLETPVLLIDCRQQRGIFSPILRLLQELRGLLPAESPTLRAYQGFLGDLDRLMQGTSEGLRDFDRSGFFLQITQLLCSIFGEKPFVAAFDDLEAADEVVKAYFKHVSRLQGIKTDLSFPPVVLSAQDLPSTQKLLATGKDIWISLTPLTAAQIEDLLNDTVAPQTFPESLTKRIAERCQGNPQFVRELLRGLISSRTLLRSGGMWNLDDLDPAKVEIPPSLVELCAKRLAALAEPERNLVETVALWDEAISPADLAAVLQENPDAIRPRISSLIAAEILRRNERAQILLVQDSLADVARRSAHAPIEKHRRLAEVLETKRPRPVERLAKHYEQSQQWEKCAETALLAASQAERIFAQDHALDLYQLALRQAREHAPAAAFLGKALGGIAGVHWRKGDRKLALQTYEEILALPLSEEHLIERSQAYRSLGISHRDRGEWEKALAFFEKAIDELGRKEPAVRAEMSALIASTYGRCAKAEEAKDWAQKALGLVSRQGEYSQSSLTVLSLVAGMESAQGNLQEAKSLYEVSFKIAEKAEDHRGSAVALNNLGAILGKQGQYGEALGYFEKSLALARQMGDATRICNSLNNIGNLEFLRGAYRKASNSLQEALELALHLDNQSMIGLIKTALGQVERDRGNFQLALTYLQDAETLRDALGDKKGLTTVHQLFAELYNLLGDYRLAQQHLQRALKRLDDPERRFSLLLLDAQIYRHLEDSRRSRHALDEAKQSLADKLSEDQQILLALSESDYFWKEGQIHKVSEMLEGKQSFLGRLNDRALALRYRLQVATLHFRQDKNARKEIENLLDDLLALENPDLLWRAQFLWGQVLEKNKEIAPAVEAYKKARELFNHVATPLEAKWRDVYLADTEKHQVIAAIERLAGTSEFMTDELKDLRIKNEQLQQLLAINRQLTSGWKNRLALLEYILDTAISLMKAKRGFLVLWKKGVPTLAAARNQTPEKSWAPEKEFSHSISEEVYRSGLPQVLMDAGNEPAFQEASSVHGLALRSVICVPLRLASQVLGVLYLDHDQIRGLFDKNEVDLLLALADQATLTLHQSESFTALQHSADETTRELQRMQILAQEQAKALEWKYSYSRIIGGKDPSMRKVFDLLDRVVPTQASVLIQGESGTGKELVAQAIHYNGARKDKPFISLNCAGLSPNLLESELFGHVRGAFTGADFAKDGLFLLASEGTIFLDEIADTPADVQAKLLRVLQEKEIRPLGGDKSFKVNTRIIAASNKLLSELVQKGAFREDLYYRLNVVQIDLPALRERAEDLDLLIDSFLGEFSKKKDGKLRELSPAARKLMHRYGWPGNVRELHHMLESLVMLHTRKRIEAEDLPEVLTAAVTQKLEDVVDLDTAREKFTANYLRELLALTGGNVSEAARRAGVYRESLHRMLRKYEIKD